MTLDFWVGAGGVEGSKVLQGHSKIKIFDLTPLISSDFNPRGWLH